MIFININKGDYSKTIINEFTVDNIDFALLNFNIRQDELKMFIDNISITNNKLNLYRCNFLISSIDVSDVIITKTLSYIPLEQEINDLKMHELRYEYIITFKKFNKINNISKLNHIYIKSRNVESYEFIKKQV